MKERRKGNIEKTHEKVMKDRATLCAGKRTEGDRGQKGTRGVHSEHNEGNRGPVVLVARDTRQGSEPMHYTERTSFEQPKVGIDSKLKVSCCGRKKIPSFNLTVIHVSECPLWALC